jgi:hypothetical protein
MYLSSKNNKKKVYKKGKLSWILNQYYMTHFYLLPGGNKNTLKILLKVRATENIFNYTIKICFKRKQ